MASKALDCPREFIDFAHVLADSAGETHRRYFRRKLHVGIKNDGSRVSNADLETEAVVRDLITKRFPTHGVIGEEFGAWREGSEVVWVIDPIDGTESFLAGIPIFGFMLALVAQDKFILGMICQSILNERWIGANGAGTRFNGIPVHTRRCKTLAGAVLHTGGPMFVEPTGDEAISRLCKACGRFYLGVECYTYGVLASGYLDLVVDQGLDIYDFAPLEPVVRNAGGVLYDWQGRTLTLKSGGALLGAGDTRVAQETIQLLCQGHHDLP